MVLENFWGFFGSESTIKPEVEASVPALNGTQTAIAATRYQKRGKCCPNSSFVSNKFSLATSKQVAQEGGEVLPKFQNEFASATSTQLASEGGKCCSNFRVGSNDICIRDLDAIDFGRGEVLLEGGKCCPNFRVGPNDVSFGWWVLVHRHSLRPTKPNFL